MTTVLVTGVGSVLGSLVAGILASQSNIRVVGVGRVAPEYTPASVEVRVCDMSGETLLAMMRAARVDVVVHLDIAGEEEAPPYEIAGRGNVYRAIEVLGACHAAGVPRVVMRSSLLVYGARPDAPVFIPESAPLSSGAPAGLLQDYIEIERLVGDFKVRHPNMRIVMIRCAPVAGNGVRSPVVQFLSRRPAPVLAGFDPRIQVLHIHDAAVALALATLNDQVEGAFNIAAHPPLILSQAILLAGGQPLPLPAFAFHAASFLEPIRSLIGALPFPIEYLNYACVGDIRRAACELHWTPQRRPDETLREIATVTA
ncbi:MAG: NAD-dependent epimerase/dehydratase family protein [Roseiflexus sp.]|jgi:UDP-glucose 4-epimerase|nr:NAD-dependent epimerase/dehydratase family protein [Roseiflexus sp.]MBO9363826.1 NAD-dependent epimerase/dehydratase family protein [Roseiflexus sp.]MBO9381037.1 NAD-dependent epimerase/dehydratase family protein [Roseiflexus sp.]MBO9387396.1 NAD-dependent epimerase/dehydratase family protein [Roseiflexus sp.]